MLLSCPATSGSAQTSAYGNCSGYVPGAPPRRHNVTCNLYATDDLRARHQGRIAAEIPSIDGVIQVCGIAIQAYCISQQKPIQWITQTAEAAARGQFQLPHFDEEPPEEVQTSLASWLEENRPPKTPSSRTDTMVIKERTASYRLLHKIFRPSRRNVWR